MVIHSASDPRPRSTLCGDYFYNYFTRGLDILFDGQVYYIFLIFIVVDVFFESIMLLWRHFRFCCVFCRTIRSRSLCCTQTILDTQISTHTWNATLLSMVMTVSFHAWNPVSLLFFCILFCIKPLIQQFLWQLVDLFTRMRMLVNAPLHQARNGSKLRWVIHDTSSVTILL